ncbi:MAG TPA: 5-formyltetrahydrofolate cyclo-ligase [Caulobacteraceae bacterium]|jgi:5-formyltetrahydrofolate cyclo-ligase|nr:5-formyltetrahydrofolate cyclo-ligase [Caulobacteraceae bacterium]
MTGGAPSETIKAKRQLRRRMLAERDAFASERDASAFARLAADAFPFDAERPPRVVSGFHRMGAEIDPSPLMARFAAAGARLCLPVVVERGAPLVFRALVGEAQLVPDAAGILAPPPTAAVLVPDLVLAPLLAFDADGWRLGYGGGFYDRTLAALRARQTVVAVGLGFSIQEVNEAPHGPGDERLDAIITEKGYRRFRHEDL